MIPLLRFLFVPGERSAETGELGNDTVPASAIVLLLIAALLAGGLLYVLFGEWY